MLDAIDGAGLALEIGDGVVGEVDGCDEQVGGFGGECDEGVVVVVEPLAALLNDSDEAAAVVGVRGCAGKAGVDGLLAVEDVAGAGGVVSGGDAIADGSERCGVWRASAVAGELGAGDGEFTGVVEVGPAVGVEGEIAGGVALLNAVNYAGLALEAGDGVVGEVDGCDEQVGGLGCECGEGVVVVVEPLTALLNDGDEVAAVVGVGGCAGKACVDGLLAVEDVAGAGGVVSGGDAIADGSERLCGAGCGKIGSGWGCGGGAWGVGVVRAAACAAVPGGCEVADFVGGVVGAGLGEVGLAIAIGVLVEGGPVA